MFAALVAAACCSESCCYSVSISISPSAALGDFSEVMAEPWLFFFRLSA